MKRYTLALSCFVATLLLLSWLKLDNRAVVVAVRDVPAGAVLRPADVQTLVISWRQPLPNEAFRCWIDCRDLAIGHTVVHPIEKYRPLTPSDIL